MVESGAAQQWLEPSARRIDVGETDGAFLPSLIVGLVILLGWGAYVLSLGSPLTGRRAAALVLFGILLTSWVVLALSAAGGRGPVPAAVRKGLVVTSVPWRWLALVGLILTTGVVYRLATWPRLLFGGDSSGYEYMAATAAAAHRFVLLAYRTPGYSFFLFWIYLAGGIGNHAAVYAAQLLLAVLTGIVMMASILVATGRRLPALLALVIGMLWHPMASASPYLMTEQLAIFLSALTIALLVNLFYHRHIASSALGLGPSLALLYEVRTPTMFWTLAAGLAALVLKHLRWRDRALLLSGAATVLVPIALINYASPYRVLTPGPAADAAVGNLGSDRFSLYLNAPNSPRLMEALYDATVTDGAGADVLSDRPPAQWASISRQRQAIIVGYISRHLGDTLQLSLRRAMLLYRPDQPWDFTFAARLPQPWLLVTDLLLLLALGGAILHARSHPKLVLALALFVVPYTASLSFFHLEPRYGLPAYPAISMLAALGLGTVVTLAITGLRQVDWTRVAAAAGVMALLGMAVLGLESWFWPALANDYAPRPMTGAGELAECYLGGHLPAAAAWQPGRDAVLAAGINGLARWDLASGGCQWQPRPIENFWDLGYSTDGRRLALATHDVRVVDGINGSLVATNFYGGYSGGTGTEITSASLDASGHRLAFASTGLRFFGVQDLDGDTPLRRLAADGYAIATRWAPAGNYLAASSSDGVVHLYDAKLSEVQVFSLPAMPLALAWSPSGDRLAAGDRLGRVWIWQAAGPNGPWLSLGSFQAHNQAIRSLAFSPDGSMIATASSDRLARVWQAADHRLLGTLSGHTATVWNISWSPNGRCLLTASADGTLKIWSRPGESAGRQDAGPVVTCHQT